MKIIEFTNVSKRYSGQPAVRDFSLEIKKGERIVILGPSGCGKTTVPRLLAGFISPDSGSIMLDGELVAADDRIIKEPEGRNLGMVFQDLALWPHLTVKGNLEFGLKAKGVPKRERGERIWLRAARTSGSSIRQRIANRGPFDSKSLKYSMIQTSSKMQSSQSIAHSRW